MTSETITNPQSSTKSESISIQNARASIQQAGTNEEKFLTFRLNNEEYGQEILRVREIIGMIDITPLPQTPDYVMGVVNLRGKIIPVIDLRVKFGMPPIPFTEETCIIVVEVEDHNIDDTKFHMGVIVDSVSEVLDIPNDQIEPAPQFGCAVSTEYILGKGKVKDKDREKVVILLDIDKVLTQEETIALIQAESGDEENADLSEHKNSESLAA